MRTVVSAFDVPGSVLQMYCVHGSAPGGYGASATGPDSCVQSPEGKLCSGGRMRSEAIVNRKWVDSGGVVRGAPTRTIPPTNVCK